MTRQKDNRRTFIAEAHWRRLDTKGDDVCRLLRLEKGWRLSGEAVFDEEGKHYALFYTVDCDAQFQTLRARVTGTMDTADIDITIERRGDIWALNGIDAPQTKNCLDVDLGFTPATNLIPLRRLSLGLGERASAPAAYLRFPELLLERLEQEYRRLNETDYDYNSPRFGYHETLVVTGVGFVTEYPPFWRGEVRIPPEGTAEL